MRDARYHEKHGRDLSHNSAVLHPSSALFSEHIQEIRG
jgi:hypothetical protein